MQDYCERSIYPGYHSGQIALPGGKTEPLDIDLQQTALREFFEETGLEVIVGEHIYTTDYFQPSAFNPADQIISIYYYVQAKGLSDLQVKNKVFDFELHQIADPNGQSEVLRWIDWDSLGADSVSLPIDKIVVRMLKTPHQ